MSTGLNSDPMTSHPQHGMTIQQFEQTQAQIAAAQAGVNTNPPPAQTPQQQPIQVGQSPSITSLFGHPAANSGTQTQVNPPQGQSYRDLFLKDPDLMAEKIKEDARKEWAAMESKKAQAARVWDEFYAENPDLKDVDWHVQSTLGDKFQELANLPLGEAKQKLATEARRRIEVLKSKNNVRSETLNDQKATTLSASGENAPTIDVPRPQTSFVGEWLSFRKKHRKV